MAKKYHIDINGDVVVCKAYLRGCPRTDYTTEEAAYSALYLQKAADDLETARKNVQESFSNPNTPRDHIFSDFSGMDMKQSPRAHAEKLDREFYATGQVPELAFVTSLLKQSNVNYNNKAQKAYITRIPVANYDDGEITSRWRIEIEQPSATYTHNPKKEIFDLDLNNDFEGEMIRAENILRESVIANSPHDASADYIRNQTNFLKKQVEKAYIITEEEIQGPYAVWAKHEGYGTFANSDPMNINVVANYNTTAFRGRIYERFLNETSYFDAITPDMNIQVFDSENGRSKNSWTVHFDTTGEKAEWKIATVIDGKIYVKVVNSPAEAYDYTYRYIQTYMRDKSEETANRKATFVSDLITDIDLANTNFINKKRIKAEKAEAARIQQDSRKSLFGKKNSGTMKSVLDLYT